MLFNIIFTAFNFTCLLSSFVVASRDSSMALWSIDSSDVSTGKCALAEDPPKIEPIFQFSNLHSHSQSRSSSSGERVRSLAYDKHNYVCKINVFYEVKLFSQIFSHFSFQLLGSLQSNPVNASLHFWDAFVFQQVCMKNNIFHIYCETY